MEAGEVTEYDGITFATIKVCLFACKLALAVLPLHRSFITQFTQRFGQES